MNIFFSNLIEGAIKSFFSVHKCERWQKVGSGKPSTLAHTSYRPRRRCRLSFFFYLHEKSMVVAFQIVGNRRKSPFALNCQRKQKEGKKKRERERETGMQESMRPTHKKPVYDSGIYKTRGKFEAKMEKKMLTNYTDPQYDVVSNRYNGMCHYLNTQFEQCRANFIQYI